MFSSVSAKFFSTAMISGRLKLLSPDRTGREPPVQPAVARMVSWSDGDDFLVSSLDHLGMAREAWGQSLKESRHASSMMEVYLPPATVVMESAMLARMSLRLAQLVAPVVLGLCGEESVLCREE